MSKITITKTKKHDISGQLLLSWIKLGVVISIKRERDTRWHVVGWPDAVQFLNMLRGLPFTETDAILEIQIFDDSDPAKNVEYSWARLGLLEYQYIERELERMCGFKTCKNSTQERKWDIVYTDAPGP